MQLRTHPKIKWEGFSNWPPAWAGSYGRGEILPVREEGILTEVEMAKGEHHLTLAIEHRGNTSSRVLCGDDDEVISRLFKILNGCIGSPISRIGDLDVDLLTQR
jgi:hypothetical protein